MEINTYAVFTPSSPAKLTFVERESINERLVDALQTPGKQLVVYGHSGSGKTTLLMNKLEQVYSAHITSRCMETTTFDQLILEAFDQLDQYYQSESVKKSGKEIRSNVSADYLGIKSEIAAIRKVDTETKMSRAVPYQLTPAKLASLIGAVGGCWVLEDFHKVKVEEKPRISQLMKVFMDMAADYPAVKIIAIGAVGTAREVVQYDREMSKRVSEIHVPLMSDAEIRLILEKGEQLLNISFDDGIKKTITHHSNGLASVCHQLALNMCQANGVYSQSATTYAFSEGDLRTSVKRYAEEESDTIKQVFEKATRRYKTRVYDNCRIILEALLSGEDDGMQHSELLSEIKRKHPQYPPSNLTNYLKSLQTDDRGSIVVYEHNSLKYRYATPFLRAYAMAVFGAGKRRGIKQTEEFIFEIAKSFHILVDPYLKK